MITYVNNNGINKIYDERKDFIIIGLTGRTGSGCSTVAKILETDEFKKLGKRQTCRYIYNKII
jgi:dCMP deaminase